MCLYVFVAGLCGYVGVPVSLHVCIPVCLCAGMFVWMCVWLFLLLHLSVYASVCVCLSVCMRMFFPDVDAVDVERDRMRGMFLGRCLCLASENFRSVVCHCFLVL